MKRDSDQKRKTKYPPVSLGSPVRFPISDFQRETRNLLAVVMNMAEGGFCRFGTAEGILKQLCARS